MAKLMYCPNCKTARECTKKGFKKGTLPPNYIEFYSSGLSLIKI